jgi:WD40 repeat protein
MPSSKTAPRLRKEFTQSNSHGGDVLTVAINPVNGQIATGGSDHKIKLWSPRGQLLKTLNHHAKSVTTVNFSADGKFLVSASQDDSVRLWTAQGILISSLDSHSREVSSVEFDPQGQVLASAGFDNTVFLWQLWKLTRNYGQPPTQPRDILSTLLKMGCESAENYLQNYPVTEEEKRTMSQPELEKVRETEEIGDFCWRLSEDS